MVRDEQVFTALVEAYLHGEDLEKVLSQGYQVGYTEVELSDSGELRAYKLNQFVQPKGVLR